MLILIEYKATNIDSILEYFYLMFSLML